MNSLQATFDYVCAPLTCPECDTQSDPCAIDLQTKSSRQPALRELRVGDQIEPLPDPETVGYLRLAETVQPGRLRVIEAWSCPNCGASMLWASLLITENVLRAVDRVSLSQESLQGSDFITPQVLTLVPLDAIPRFNAMPPTELRAEVARLGQEFEAEKRSSLTEGRNEN
jgi:hypothetical protein